MANVGMPWLLGAVSHASEGNHLCVSFDDALKVYINTSSDMALETGGAVWQASYRMANFLIHNPNLVRGKRVLDLGCGVGLTGLVCAALGAKSVLLTDMPGHQQQIIQSNIDLNRTKRSVSIVGDSTYDDILKCTSVRCGSLAFGDEKIVLASGDEIEAGCSHFDVVLGTDIGYSNDLHDDLARTIAAFTAHDKEASPVVALLAEEVRWKDIYSWYRDSLIEAGLSCILESNLCQEGARLSGQCFHTLPDGSASVGPCCKSDEMDEATEKVVVRITSSDSISSKSGEEGIGLQNSCQVSLLVMCNSNTK